MSVDADEFEADARREIVTVRVAAKALLDALDLPPTIAGTRARLLVIADRSLDTDAVLDAAEALRKALEI